MVDILSRRRQVSGDAQPHYTVYIHRDRKMPRLHAAVNRVCDMLDAVAISKTIRARFRSNTALCEIGKTRKYIWQTYVYI